MAPRRIKLPRDILAAKLFRQVQKIPYQISDFDETDHHLKEVVNTGIKQGDSRHKSLLFYNLLQQSNYVADKVKTIFDWKDLPIPAEILGILKKSGTRWVHDVVRFKVNDNYSVIVDCSWNLELKKKGFPVTEDWDGVSNTIPITPGKIDVYDLDKFNKEKHNIHIDKEEAMHFAEELNKWLRK